MKTYKHLDVRAVSAERSELKEKAAQYPYVIAHMYSDILCGNCVHDGINWDELVELRAFDEKGELHVYEQNGSLKAVEITEKENADAEEDTVIKYYQFVNQFPRQISMQTCSKRVSRWRNEDGQAVVVYTRPFDWRP